jgi:hypothetical protein
LRACSSSPLQARACCRRISTVRRVSADREGLCRCRCLGGGGGGGVPVAVLWPVSLPGIRLVALRSASALPVPLAAPPVLCSEAPLAFPADNGQRQPAAEGRAGDGTSRPSGASTRADCRLADSHWRRYGFSRPAPVGRRLDATRISRPVPGDGQTTAGLRMHSHTALTAAAANIESNARPDVAAERTTSFGQGTVTGAAQRTLAEALDAQVAGVAVGATSSLAERRGHSFIPERQHPFSSFSFPIVAARPLSTLAAVADLCRNIRHTIVVHTSHFVPVSLGFAQRIHPVFPCPSP